MIGGHAVALFPRRARNTFPFSADNSAFHSVVAGRVRAAAIRRMSSVGNIAHGGRSGAQFPVFRLRFCAKGDTFAVDAHLIHFAAVV